MARTTADEVQVWLADDKHLIDPDDELVEEPTASEIVLGKLARTHDVTGWTDHSNTPRLVRQVISMLVAAWRYDKQYSEATNDENNYATRLKEMANDLIIGIAEGSIDLLDVTGDVFETGTLAFYPDDTVGIEDEEEAARFTIGAVF